MYDLFLAEMAINDAMYVAAVSDRNQFIISGMLQMDLVMKKFYEHFEEIYSDNDQKFIEENGRKLFLLYLKPIINGTGNYYIEARTRDNKRTDKQLFEYLEIYKQERGYLLSFNFNKQKKTGIHEVRYKEKKILEVVV